MSQSRSQQASGSNNTLRYGQIIRIHGNKCLETKSDIQEPRGMIVVKGFTDRDARYRTFETLKDCQFYRMGLFQILPKGPFQKGGTSNDIADKEAYQQIINERMSSCVKFGEDVVFRHVDSLDYLSGSVRCSDGGLGAFKVELCDKLVANLLFRLEAFRSFEKEGDNIMMESPLRIKNISNRCYISTERNESKYNIVTTYSKSFTWLIHLHDSLPPLNDTGRINTHDMIYLTHTKNGGHLCIEDPSLTRTPSRSRYCIKLNLDSTGYQSCRCLWVIEKRPTPSISPYRKSDKGNLGTEGTYSLRQLLNGEYLEIPRLARTSMVAGDPRQLTIRSAKGLSNPDDFVRDMGLIKIGGLKSRNEGLIDMGDELPDSEQLHYRDKSNYSCNQLRLLRPNDPQSQHCFKITKIDDKEKREVLFVLSTYQLLEDFAEQLSFKNVERFESTVKTKRLNSVDYSLICLIAFLKNCGIQQIQEDLMPDSKKQFICMSLEICVKLFRILEQMERKILQEIYTTAKAQNQAFLRVFNRAYYLIWTIVKGNPLTKIYVCEDWLHIVLDHAIQIEEESVHTTLNELIVSNQLVVSKFLRENNNQLLNRIIDLFTLKPPHERFLNILRTACINNNAPVVANQKLILDYFFKKLSDVARFKFYDRESLPSKEPSLAIWSYISKDKPDYRSLKVFFEESLRIDLAQTSKYLIAYLNLLADVCFGRNTIAEKEVSDTLALRQRNQNKPVLSALDTLILILNDHKLKQVNGSINLLRATLRLINNAFVESADQNPVLRMRRYRNLSEDQNDPPIVEQNFRKIMSFIVGELTQFESFYSSSSLEHISDKKARQKASLEEKELFLTILTLLKSTLFFGYWSIKEQLGTLLPLLLNILTNKKNDIVNGHTESLPANRQLQEFEKFKVKVSKSTPTVELIVRCKQLACQLIEIIFDFRSDKLVSECVAVYKRVPQDSPAVWIAELKKIFETESSTEKSSLSRMTQLMVELSIHRNPKLFFKSLAILRRHFFFKRAIFEQTLKLSLYDEKEGALLSKQIEKRRGSLGRLEEENLLYNASQNSYREVQCFLAWLSQCLKEREYSDPPQFSEIEAKLSEFKMRQSHFNERDQINEFSQRLLKNKDIHPVLMKFIGLSKQPLSTFRPSAIQVLKSVYRFLTLLVSNHPQAKDQIVNSLPKIKAHIIEQAALCNEKYSHSLSQRKDCEAIDLLSELYTNNKKLLFDDTEMESVAIQACQLINTVDIKFYFKSNLLDFLRSLLYYRGEPIRINQCRILAKLHDSHKANIYYCFITKPEHDLFTLVNTFMETNSFLKKVEAGSEEDTIGQISEMRTLMHNRLTSARGRRSEIIGVAPTHEVVMEPVLTYYVTLLNLLSNLVQKNCTINISKCRQVHQYVNLMELLKKSRGCYPLKTYLRSYVNGLFYWDAVEQDRCIDIVRLDFPLMIKELNEVITLLVQHRDWLDHKLALPIRYTYFGTYIHLYIEQLVVSLDLLLRNEIFTRELWTLLNREYERDYYYLFYFVMRIYERLRWLTEFYRNNTQLRGLINKVSRQFQIKLLSEFQTKYISVFDKNEEKNHQLKDYSSTQHRRKAEPKNKRAPALVLRSKNLIHKLHFGEIKNYFAQTRPEKYWNFPLTFLLPYGYKGELDPQTKDVIDGDDLKNIANKLNTLFQHQKPPPRLDHHNQRQKLLRKMIEDESRFAAFINSYHLTEFDTIYSVDENSLQYYGFSQKFVSFEQYVNIFVKINTEQPESISNDLKIFFFRLLIQYIIKNGTQQSDDNKSALHSLNVLTLQSSKQCQARLKNAQSFLNNANVSQILLETIKTTKNLELLSVVLEFGIAFLFGGNQCCQNSILTLMKRDRRNRVFLKFEHLISTVSRKLTAQMTDERNRIKSGAFTLSPTPFDVDRRFNQQSNSMVARTNYANILIDDQADHRLERELFKRLFSFLQLLCQCNNFGMKNYIREQVNEQGIKKNNSFNLINVATFQIRRLFKQLDEGAYDLLLPILDFVNEVVAMPCIQNQISLCETTFLEDLGYVASVVYKKNPKQTPIYFLKLFQRGVQLIHNVLEGKDPFLNNSLLEKLNVEFLLGIITSKAPYQVGDLRQLFMNRQMEPLFSEQLVEIIEVYVVLLKLEVTPKFDRFREKDKERKRNWLTVLSGQPSRIKETLELISQQILRIEVSSSRGRQFIYFPKHPIFTKLSSTTRDNIMTSVSRASQREKLKSFFAFKEEVFMEIQYNMALTKQTYFGIPFEPKIVGQLSQVSFSISYIIIALWLFTSDVVIEFDELFYAKSGRIGLIVSAVELSLSLAQLAATSLYFLSYVKCNYELAKYRHQQSITCDKSQQNRVLGTYSPDSSKITKMSTLAFQNPLVTMVKFDVAFMGVLMCLMCSIIGTFWSQSLFLGYILIYFSRNQTLSNVFSAVSLSSGQLFSIGMLQVVFVFVFCLLFYEMYVDVEELADSGTCSTLMSCIMNLVMSGSIRGQMKEPQLLRVTADIFYFIFIDLLFANILGGIMIDNFAELRSKREETANDKKNMCYICGKDRATLEKNCENFEDHFQTKHYMWNYLYFIYYLRLKKHTELSGLEYEIKSLCQEPITQEAAIKWIPFNESEKSGTIQEVSLLERDVELLLKGGINGKQAASNEFVPF